MRTLRRPRRTITLLASMTLAMALLILVPATSQASQSCGSSLGYQVCLTAPDGVLSGDRPIDVTVTGSSSGIYEMEFGWGTSSSTTAHLLSDFEAPWGFVWRTDRYLDATQYLNVRVKTTETNAGAPVSLLLTLQNGNVTSVPTNPNDWASLFQPRPPVGDPVFAAVGDGADGRTRSNAVAASIQDSNASILLYLGDVYERGTPAEWDYNYGRSSFEGGGGRAWGALAGFTAPTDGNHEVGSLPVWHDYWHGRPDYTTFVSGGVRFFDLDSECSTVGGCGVGSAQYLFVQTELANNASPCVVAFWHRPVLGSVDPDNTEMRPLWSLLANNGGDLVLNGHMHDMEAYAPLNATLVAGQPDSHMVELVSGAGGHALYSTVNTDPRGVWQALKTPGAVFVTAVGGATGSPTRLDWAFKNSSGNVVTTASGPGQGSVGCGGSVDTDPPSAPGKPTGSSASTGTITLNWAASTDASPPITYKVYRDGDLVNAVGTTTSTTFTDTNLTPGSQHTYAIGATDKLGNGPTFGPTSDPITVTSAIFSDDFSTGDFSKWSGVTRMTIDNGTGGVAPPSARALTSAQTGFAFENLSGTLSSICMSANVNVSSLGSSPTLFRLRTAANAAVARVYVNAAGILYIRSDASGAQFYSGTKIDIGWHSIKVCGTVGASGTWDLYRDGVKIVNAWVANTGTTPVGRVEIGNAQAITATINFDDVVVA